MGVEGSRSSRDRHSTPPVFNPASKDHPGVGFVLIEKYHVARTALRSRFIADHLSQLCHDRPDGNFMTVVVVESPGSTLAVVRKFLLQHIPKLKHRQAETLLSQCRNTLTKEIECIRTLPFAARLPGDNEHGVFFVTPEEAGVQLAGLG